MTKRARRITIFWVVVIIVIILLLIPAVRSATREGADESVRSIAETVQERALQCYVIEGAYPASLSYLEENYGLTLNTDDYLVVYTPVAENLPPDVRVVKREKK